jgi:hypothetical protein
MDATDAIFSVVNGAIELNQQKIAKKIELWTAVYSTQCFLGWYTFGSELYESHLHINNMVIIICIYIALYSMINIHFHVFTV